MDGIKSVKNFKSRQWTQREQQFRKFLKILIKKNYSNYFPRHTFRSLVKPFSLGHIQNFFGSVVPLNQSKSILSPSGGSNEKENL